ncbi:MAG: hypothetical protein HND40_06665 [Ignavibacteriota bacterium]|jgi:hypothetical protein|nr:hypothetical protein [Ignavibacteriota bacterium]MBV6420911.1 hypothetical protein [Ignavibacteriaceae bacterium]MCO6446819.1 hypothetical protein [Ignavibacterium album]MDT3696761.1 hypothetical protein [Ignavibacterium sp.]QKJ99262.1 MAG: hypothetical protein HND40_06665 [Ignavibacteriota bacterium]
MNIDKIAYKDRSEFLRGFAAIIRKNNCGNEDEQTMFLTIGKYFGFEMEFLEYSLGHLMVNKYILEEPAIFSTKPIAEFFINDVAKILSHTNSMTDASKDWLMKTAEGNKVDFVL